MGEHTLCGVLNWRGKNMDKHTNLESGLKNLINKRPQIPENEGYAKVEVVHTDLNPLSYPIIT